MTIGTFKVLGVQATLAKLEIIEKEIRAEAEKGIKNAAFFMKGEVVQSIAGRRAEPPSVDTSLFKNTIDVKKIEDGNWEIFSPLDYAIYLEKGTSRITARGHFGNSLSRNRLKIREFINEGMEKAFR